MTNFVNDQLYMLPTDPYFYQPQDVVNHQSSSDTPLNYVILTPWEFYPQYMGMTRVVNLDADELELRLLTKNCYYIDLICTEGACIYMTDPGIIMDQDFKDPLLEYLRENNYCAFLKTSFC